jgi:hypothetical protein
MYPILYNRLQHEEKLPWMTIAEGRQQFLFKIFIATDTLKTQHKWTQHKLQETNT